MLPQLTRSMMRWGCTTIETRCLTRAGLHRRWKSSSKGSASDRVHFPGAVTSRFTTEFHFHKVTVADALPTYRILDINGHIVDKTQCPPDIDQDEVIKLYTDMVFISTMDAMMFNAQRHGRVSFYMTSDGEEAIGVGSASALCSKDPIFAQYREQSALKTRGFTADMFMSQLFSTNEDSGKGRNAPTHYGSSALNVHSISSPLATQIPQAAGAAYAMKMRARTDPSDKGQVVVCYFGEGAASEGDFHAGLNIAATRRCPVLFICRNNGYAISTPSLEQYCGDGIASRGVGYGIATIRVDGNDVLAVREATRQARRLALSDGSYQPVLIEAMTYRSSHHSTSDDSFSYRARTEVEDWKGRDDPISRLQRYMKHQGFWDEDKEKELRSNCRRTLMDAFSKASKQNFPPLLAMVEGTYAELTEEQVEQVHGLRKVIERYPDEYDLSKYENGLESLTLNGSSRVRRKPIQFNTSLDDPAFYTYQGSNSLLPDNHGSSLCGHTELPDSYSNKAFAVTAAYFRSSQLEMEEVATSLKDELEPTNSEKKEV